jgi:putative ABC transport system permease protein
VEEEVRWHLEMRAQELRSQGSGEEEALRAARRVFGNRSAVVEASRATWGAVAVEQVIQDLRHAFRRIRQRPGFSLSIVAVLALGIGAATAMFSAVDAAMLRPLPFPHPDQLLSLRRVAFQTDLAYATERLPPIPSGQPQWLTVLDLRRMPELFSHIGAYGTGAMNLSDAEGPEHVRVGVVTPDLFATLGAVPFRGRVFTAEEGAPAGPTAVILSYGLWQRQYGRREMVNQVIRLADHPYTVVGIMSPDFSFPERSDLWIPLVVPLSPDVRWILDGGGYPSQVVARVAPGVTAAAAAERLFARWDESLHPAGAARSQDVEDYLTELRTHGVTVPFQQQLLGDRRTVLLILLGVTAVLLLIACSNAASLMLSQGPIRRREIAVREVLGATRGRVVRQLLIESLVLSLAGAAVGIAIAAALFGFLRPLLPATLAGVAAPQLDGRVLGSALVLALLVTVGVGLWPALRITGVSAGETIKSGGFGSNRGRATGMRRALVGVQVMLSVVLLIGGGLLLRSFVQLVDVDRGIRTARVASMRISLPMRNFPRNIWEQGPGASNTGGDGLGLEPQRWKRAAIEAKLNTTAGITSAALVYHVPFSGDVVAYSVSLLPDSVPMQIAGVRNRVQSYDVSAGYFATMDIPIIMGRTFAAGGDSGIPPVAVVSATVAARSWPGVNPLGRTFRLGSADAKPVTVIGVAADVHEQGLTSDTLPQIYMPIEPGPVQSPFAVVARGAVPAETLLVDMRRAVAAVDPSQAVYDLRVMDDVLRAAVAPQQANTALVTIFAALALALAVLGTYAVVASDVASRARDFGIRAALGATHSHLLQMVLREMSSVVIAGVLAGLTIAWALSRVATALIYNVSTHDPATFVVVPLALIVAATAAILVPATRARRINPADVMRAE